MRVVTAVLVVAALLVVPATAGAQAPLPVGEADGVRIVRERGAIVVVFTPKAKTLWRRPAGRNASVDTTEFLENSTASGGTTMRVPKRGRRLRTGDRTRGMDYCDVWLEHKRGARFVGRELLVSIPLTQRGAVHLDEREKTHSLLGVLFLAETLAHKQRLPGHPTAEQLFARWPRLTNSVVALAGSADTPPAGKLGYWSDGAEHVALVTLSASGRRLFIEYEGDVLHTNVAGYLFGGID